MPPKDNLYRSYPDDQIKILFIASVAQTLKLEPSPIELATGFSGTLRF